MNTNELTMGCTGACFLNFKQLQKSNETELVKCVSVKTFYQVRSCKSNLTSGHVEKNSFGIIHSVPFSSPEAPRISTSDLYSGQMSAHA